jgi:hypothetical protein
MTSSAATGKACRKIDLSSAVQSALMTVKADELKAAHTYQQQCTDALRSNAQTPVKPAKCTADAVLILNMISNAQSDVPKSVKNAKLHRTKAMAMYRYFGNFQLFSTHSPDDLSKSAVHNISTPDNAFVPGVDSVEAAMSAARDPAACAMAYDDTVNTLIDMLYRFDIKAHDSHPGGGLFGSVCGFFGMTEEQQRQSLHLHLLTFIKGLPQSCQDLISIVKDPLKVKKLLQYVDSTVKTQHPIATHELLRPDASKHVCDSFASNPEELPHLTLWGVPEKYSTMTSSQLNYPDPPDVECSKCEHELSSLSLTKTWALANCGNDARHAWENGNFELHGIPIDSDYIFDLPQDASTTEMIDPTPDGCTCPETNEESAVTNSTNPVQACSCDEGRFQHILTQHTYIDVNGLQSDHKNILDG